MSRAGINPSVFVHKLEPIHKEWVQGVHKILAGGVDMGNGTGTAPAGAGINAGVYTKFERGNGTGVLIRIAAVGVLDSGALYNWGAPGVGIVLNHGLQRQPIGFYIVDKDKAVDVYRTAAPDLNTITVASTDASASVTLYVF